ncbi:thioredoxin family protein [Xylanibacillus composti]|uniref:Thioredoxin n=1 Tax=Xylanibacillus composti TaxID=1572762 RepID=A0A8J4M3M5_9BACL|nr:thioredoxin family protein [Xylanibacillus composti]GIQ71025.1 thioredoxin [Xylanibacillus composti]
MSKNLAHKLNKGISPQAFMEGMEKNKEAFQSWYDQFAWESEEDKEFFESLSFRDDLRCLILAADWCGDVVRNVPVVFRALEAAQMPVEVLIMEQHLETMDEFLTMGGRSIPIVLFADTGGVVLGQWGPRPKHVQEVMIAFKQENPDREAPDYQENIAAARQEMVRRYGEDAAYQQVIIRELKDVLAGC